MLPDNKLSGDLIAEILCIAGELGGEARCFTTLDHTGRQTKKIVIEYEYEED